MVCVCVCVCVCVWCVCVCVIMLPYTHQPIEVLIQQIDPEGSGRVTFSMFRSGIETFLTTRESLSVSYTMYIYMYIVCMSVLFEC